MFFKRLLFKLLELGLGLRPYFSLRTRNPVFVNWRLDEEERALVAASLPAGFSLQPLRFLASDAEPAYFVSCNLYEIRYPRPEMKDVRKVRCEINTFVRDAAGREGIYVFCGSPFVSKDEGKGVFGKIADFAERLVIGIYGSGRLTGLRYELGEDAVRIALDEPEAQLSLDVPLARGNDALRDPRQGRDRLSDDYRRFNDVSFFTGGRHFDLVNVDSAFALATLEAIDTSGATARLPFFARPPDTAYIHRGEIAYLVSALHRSGAP